MKAEEAPKSWEELLQPKWKGKFGIANSGIHVTTLQFVLNLDKLLGPKWLKVVEGWAQQDPRVGRSLADNIQPLTSGEIQVAVGYIKDKFQYPGPIEYVRMNKYLASLSFMAINRQAPHANAARLFADFSHVKLVYEPNHPLLAKAYPGVPLFGCPNDRSYEIY